MTNERAWPARAMYILIAAALAIGLMIMAAPTPKVSAAPDPGLSEWTRVDTPTTEGWVLAPCSTIIDYALAEAGEVAYAIVDQEYVECPDPCDDGREGRDSGYYLLKSDDYGATWDDITGALEDLIDTDGGDYIEELVQVATDWVDPDFVAVAVWWWDQTAGSYYLHVFFSTDGGDTFEDADEVEDGGVYFDAPWEVSDLAVSYEADDEREIAIGGVVCCPTAVLFRCTVTGDSASAWEDATMYDGWDNQWTGDTDSGNDIYSEYVTDIIFSPSWATDKTILVVTVATGANYWDVYLQSGTWGNSAGWNEMSTLGIEAVLVLEDENLPMWLTSMDARAIAGLTLPEDYNSKNNDERVLWVWVNYYDSVSGDSACQIIRVDDDSAGAVGPLGQVEDGELWLTNISYHGTIAEGEALAGVLGTGSINIQDSPWDILTECCPVVQVYRNDGIRNMDICCERWHDACKPPTGNAAMAVSYVGEDKAYAVALYGDPDVPCNDEGAWSMTFDDGDTWNQLSLIDTFIHYFSDVAVSPDCNKTFLVSVNKVEIAYESYCECDSVWLHAVNLPEAEEYSGQWLRTWSGALVGDWWFDGYEAGLLRLAPEETTGDTVFLVDYATSNVYWNGLETLACWDPLGATDLDEIVELAAQDADTVFGLDYDGDVAMWDGDEWQDPVESGVDYGYTIAVWGDWILVGGEDGDVAYSDDGGETFDLLEDFPTIDGYVTVAFDTYFDTNMTVYAATDDDYTGGIYSWVIGESEEWTDLNAWPMENQLFPESMWTSADGDDLVEVAFTGLMVDRPGNPYTSPDNGGVIYATYYGEFYDDGWVEFTGVARSLERMVSVCTTCLDWDFLHVGLTYAEWGYDCPYPEGFEAYPDALKICGCLTPDTNTHLFAIDAWWDYDMCENEFGSVWTYEDCYAKKAPEITSPDDGAIIPPDACLCQSGPFTVTWDSICDACSYDIAFALDEDFEMPVDVPGQTGLVYHVVSDTPSFSVPAGLSAETTYYIRVRGADAATGEIIHSWWSDPISITTAAFGEAGTIHLVAPEPGALNQPIKNLGFSWNLAATWDSFDWVLSANADLSSPLDSKTGLTSTATSYMGTLDHGTTYYWQVTAYNEGALISTSAIGTFTTGELGPYCDPTTGMCFDTQQELEDYQGTLPTPGTPFWVWVVIAIGAVLVIVVIVLIFRTRRV